MEGNLSLVVPMAVGAEVMSEAVGAFVQKTGPPFCTVDLRCAELATCTKPSPWPLLMSPKCLPQEARGLTDLDTLPSWEQLSCRALRDRMPVKSPLTIVLPLRQF